MPTLTSQYSVVLRSDLPQCERQLLENFCCKITTESGSKLIYFMCTKIDVSHGIYIDMQTFKPGDEHVHPIRVPHHFVFLISGSEERATIGFISGEASAQ